MFEQGRETGQGYAALFVDDDRNVLRGLERLMRPLHQEWTMTFVTSGRAAVEILGTSAVDVLVTDMRMPGMSGVELMEAAQTLHPGVVRIALSGSAERDMIVRAAQLAHQYLSKPCEPGVLRDRLQQAVRLRSLLRDSRLQAIVSRVSTLRSVPSLYLELMAAMQASDPSIARIASIVAQDPALTAKVLQVINSAYFGLRSNVSDPETAVRLLGLDTIKSLALAVDVYGRFGRRRQADPSAVWHHCTRTARTARDLARRLGLDERQTSEAFTAGLLHDVGKLILREALDGYDGAVAAGRREGLTESEAETGAFGAGHAHAGAYLLGLWGLPYGIVEAVAWHHRPTQSGTSGPSALTAVHLADVLDHLAHPNAGARTDADHEYLAAVGLEEIYREWQAAGVGVSAA